ncbi:MAG TPA: hypothetical protein VEX18_04230, partial [Polyangiaceae bacterium]|nr:hypothetical protein [Polyangiaceae bacterium]
RPGEKLFEELATDSEEADKTRHPKIFVGRIPARAYDDVQREFATLRGLLQQRRAPVQADTLATLVPEFVRQPFVSLPAVPAAAGLAASLESTADDREALSEVEPVGAS